MQRRKRGSGARRSLNVKRSSRPSIRSGASTPGTRYDGAMGEGVLPLARLQTGVPGLDEITGGGLFEGGVYIVRGDTGAGKTILVNQICFHVARQGRRAIYISLLAEAHDRLVAQLSGLAFFDESLLVSHLSYINGYQVLVSGGIDELRHTVQRLVREQRASVLVLDGLETIESFTRTPADFKQFLHMLQGFSTVAKCSMLAVSAVAGDTFHPEFTVADGLFFLGYRAVGLRGVRELMIQKLRGTRILDGRHAYRISPEGVAVFPRLEAREVALPPLKPKRLSLGRPEFDEMTHGGVTHGSATLLLGTPGSGKTLLGLQCLAAGCAQGEPGLYFGFYEPPDRIVAKGDAIGLGLSAYVSQGLLSVSWVPPFESPLDEIAAQILGAVTACKAKRVFIDGIDGMAMAATYPDRLPKYLAALSNHVCRAGATLFYSGERQSNEAFGPGTLEVSALVENIFLVRYVELRSQLYRIFSILKMRESDYDTSLRQFRISNRGIVLAKSFRSAESILRGTAQPPRKRQKRG